MFKSIDNGNSVNLDASLASNDPATVTRSVLTAQDSSGSYTPLITRDDGSLNVALRGTVYNETQVVNPTPIINDDFLYNTLHTQKYVTFIKPGSSIDVHSGVVDLNIDTTSEAYSVLRTAEVMRYFPGTTNEIRFSCVFNAPVEGSTQRCGVGSSGSELSFGYDGSEFGVIRGYDGTVHIMELEITSPATGTETATLTLNSLSIFTVDLTNAGGLLSFTAHQVATANYFGAWETLQIDNKILFAFAGVKEQSGVYAFSSATATATFTDVTTGTDQQVAFTPESSFNVNSQLSQSLNKQLGNVYVIRYAWLGFNGVEYSVVDPTDNVLKVVHVERYTNMYTVPFIANPNMPIQMSLASITSTTPMTLRIGSFAGFLLGQLPVSTLPAYGVDNVKTSVTTQKVILTLQNRWVMNGNINQSTTVIRAISLACEGNKSTTFRIIKNADTFGTNTTSDYSNFQHVDDLEESLCVVDKTAATLSGGIQIDKVVLSKSNSTRIEFNFGSLVLERGYTLSVTAESQTATDATCAIVYTDYI